VEALRKEWFESPSSKTNSLNYRDELWSLAWQQYADSLAHRGTLSTPNLFMNRGRLLVSQGKYERAIPEFQNALAFAQNSTYEVIREESAINALRAIGVAYWNMRNYPEARQWYLKAQALQKKSGHPWVPTLDEEVRKISALSGQP
jgi:tetratricopeptide (TPR) repeat protein